MSAVQMARPRALQLRPAGDDVASVSPPPTPVRPRPSAAASALLRLPMLAAAAVLAVAALVAALHFEVPALARFLLLQAAFGSVRERCAPCGCAAGLPPAVAALRAHCAEPLLPSGPHSSAHGVAPAGLTLSMSVAACAAAAEALAAAPALPPPAPAAAARVLFHLYVRPDLGSSSSRSAAWQVTTLLSIVASQPAGAFQIVVWSPQADAPVPAVLVPLLATAPVGTITYRVFDAVAEAEGSPLANTALLRFRDGRGWADSDIFRLVALWRYGGVYLDLDVLLFRDVMPLLAWEWTTEFAGDGRAGDGLVTLNNAVQHFFARSPAIVRLMELAVYTPPVLRSWMYGPLLLDRAFGGGGGGGGDASFAALPWCFFHGMFSVGDEASAAREITAEHLLGDADWAQSAVMRTAFGLHMHGLPGSGRVPAPGSILAVMGARARAGAALRGIKER